MPIVDAASATTCWAGAGRLPAAARPPVAAAAASATVSSFAVSDANRELNTVLLLHFGSPDAPGAVHPGPAALLAGFTAGSPLSVVRREAAKAAARCWRS